MNGKELSIFALQIEFFLTGLNLQQSKDSKYYYLKLIGRVLHYREIPPAGY